VGASPRLPGLAWRAPRGRPRGGHTSRFTGL